MKMKLLMAMVFSWGSLMADPTEKLLNYLKEINDALIMVVKYQDGSKKQGQHVERAKFLVQEAILAEGITQHPTLYAIAGILLNDPLLAARAVELEKEKAPNRSSASLGEREGRLEDAAEAYRQAMEDRIEEEEMFLMNASSMMTEDIQKHQRALSNLIKTRKWAEAQVLAHGFLREAICMYQQNKLEKGV